MTKHSPSKEGVNDLNDEKKPTMEGIKKDHFRQKEPQEESPGSILSCMCSRSRRKPERKSSHGHVQEDLRGPGKKTDFFGSGMGSS